MGYRKVDPRTKAAAIKAMIKAVDGGLSAHAAARELSQRYGIGATTLQKYHADATAAAEHDDSQAEVGAPAAEPVTEPSDTVEQPQTTLTEQDSLTVALADTHDPTPSSANTLSEQFAHTLQTLSGQYVARLQAAALDDLIAKMQQLRADLPHR